MNVKQLIEKLQQCDPDALVVYQSETEGHYTVEYVESIKVVYRGYNKYGGDYTSEENYLRDKDEVVNFVNAVELT